MDNVPFLGVATCATSRSWSFHWNPGDWHRSSRQRIGRPAMQKDIIMRVSGIVLYSRGNHVFRRKHEKGQFHTYFFVISYIECEYDTYPWHHTPVYIPFESPRVGAGNKNTECDSLLRPSFLFPKLPCSENYEMLMRVGEMSRCSEEVVPKYVQVI